MLGKIPIPKGPILDWVKNEYQGEGHETKAMVIQETADLANKILASYTFYIETPDTPSAEHKRRFTEDVETYGKRAIELQTFALQSDAPQPPEADVEKMRSAQRALAEESAKIEGEGGDPSESEQLLQIPIADLNVSRELLELDPKETLDDFFNRIDDDLYLMYYSILEAIVETCTDCAITGEVHPREFDELKVSLQVALRHVDGGSRA
jgi:nucleotide-binding universal stress UspA family protein